MSLLVRYDAGAGPRVGVYDGLHVAALPLGSMAEALRLPLVELRRTVERPPAGERHAIAEVRLLAPVDEQEVWAAGVTYLRSRDARLEESGGADVYERVYASARPELFFKSLGRRVVGPGEPVGVRSDSRWNLPEPELTAVLNARAEIVGYTAGNDVSSRDIEGENALYLPQAKVYRRSCALGPGIRPAWELGRDPVFDIALLITRGGATIAAGRTDTSRMVRRIPELAQWLWRCLDFEDGVALMTGTGIVPEGDVSLSPDDEVHVTVDAVGTLRNVVVEVGEAQPAGAAPAA
jgi:2-dehydro-3-deoxy-D-arabinonate dehydratase